MLADRLKRGKRAAAGGGSGTTGFTTSYLDASYNHPYPASGTALTVASGTDTNLQPTTFSVEVWFNFTSATDVVFLDLYPQTSHTAPYYGYHLRTTSNVYCPLFGFNNAGTYNSLQGGAFTAGWNHIVATFQSGAQNLYLNGTLVASSTFTGTPTWYATGVYVNVFHNLGGFSTYTGSVALVKLYNTVMDATTVAAHHTAGHP